MSLEHFPPNPDYGRGCFRRRVIIRRNGQATLATIDDTHHAMWVLIEHDGRVITSIEGGITRGPATTCSASSAGLAALVGWPLDERPTSRDLPPTMNCTHLGDLTIWALTEEAGGPPLVEYEVFVADEIDTPVWATVSRNGTVLHKWLIYGHQVLAPDYLEGCPLMRGFVAWARTVFKGKALEAALMLQRGVFVARGRKRLVDLSPPVPLRAAVGMAGVCFSYSGERLATATSVVGYVRDFTEKVIVTPPPARVVERFEGWTQ
jgi:hypothetical protein